MNLRWTVIVIAVFGAHINLLHAQDPVVLPVVGDLNLTPSIFGGIVSGQVPSEGNPESWSALQTPVYVPGFGGLPGQPLRLLIPPTFDPVTHIFQWDLAGSSPGTFTWSIEGSNSAGSDSGTISVANIIYPDYPVPIVDDLKFIVESPDSGGGQIAGIVTVGEDSVEWSELLYPTYKPQPNVPGSVPSGIQSPNWNSDNRQFSWNMHGAQPGIYSWIVKANNHNGFGAGAIEVTILVPEPSTVLLTLLAHLGAASMVRRR
jgi:hypothetical protein